MDEPSVPVPGFFLERKFSTGKDKRKSDQYSLHHHHSCCLLYSHSNILVVCNHLPPRMGQHEFWSLFYFRGLPGRCGWSSRSHVCVPPVLSPGKIYYGKTF